MAVKPLSSLYGGLLDLRNSLYDAGWFAGFTPTQRCIAVGNLTVGGTGKTPAVTYLLRYLLHVDPALTGELATISRGYGRKTRGFRIATPADTAETLGDEPLQLYQAFGEHALGNRVTVCVDERRANALQRLAAEQPAIGTVLLDDAFQHRAVRPHLNLLLSDYNRPFYEDVPFPGGRLRERRHGARRADAVIVTKCPQAPTPAERAEITARIGRYTRPETPVWFAGLHYDTPRRFGTHAPVQPAGPVLLVSGLADARPLEGYVRATWGLVDHVAYGDHHPYTRADVDRLLGTLPAGHTLLTTEKDRVKLMPLFTADELTSLPLAYLPVAMQFWHESDADALAERVLQTLKNR